MIDFLDLETVGYIFGFVSGALIGYSLGYSKVVYVKRRK